MEQDMPVIVLNPMTPDNILTAVKGKPVGSYIS
jgi:hypothetical protein